MMESHILTHAQTQWMEAMERRDEEGRETEAQTTNQEPFGLKFKRLLSISFQSINLSLAHTHPHAHARTQP